MAVSIIKQPAEISFSRNPQIWGFKTDNLYSNAGTKSVFLLSFPLGPLEDGVAVDVSYNDQIQTFQVVDYPDNSGLQILSGKNHPLIADLTLLEWCNQVVTLLSENYLLSRDFEITVDLTGVDPRVKLEAKQAAPKYDLQINEQPAINLILLINGIERARRANFTIWCQILMSNATHTGYELILKDLPLAVNDEGEAYPNFNQTFTQALIGIHNDFEQPDPAMPVAQRNRRTCRKYTIRYAEAYGSKQVIQKVWTTSPKWVMLGGSGRADEETFSIADTFLTGAEHKFLKQEPLLKTVTLNQPEWLSVVWLSAAVASLKLHVKVYFTEGDPAEVDAFTVATVSKYDKLTFPVGATQLNFSALYPTKTVTYYQVWLTAADVSVSEIRTYQLNYNYEPFARWFCFLSSLGGYDTFITLGKGSSQYELISQRASITKSNTFTFKQGETLEFDSKLDLKESVLTGWLKNKRELKHYRDFFLSWDRFQVKYNRTYPVMVNSKSIKEFKEGEHLYALEFEIGYRYSDESWTEEEEDVSPAVPINVSQFWPPVSIEVPENMDHLYYRKTNTYNKAELDDFITTLTATEAARHADHAALILALELAIVSKSDSDHTHAGVYVTISEFDTFVDALGAALLYKGLWDAGYTTDPLDVAVIPGYSINDVVEWKGSFWRSLNDENEDEPTLGSVKWIQIVAGVPVYESAVTAGFTSSGLEAAYPGSKVGTRVIQKDMVDGATVYEKMTATTWGFYSIGTL